MSQENQATIATYEVYGQNYIDDALTDPIRAKKHAALKDTIQRAVSGLPKDAKMFEIGSGYGRDAEIVQELGYSIQPSDVTEVFLNYMTGHGLSPIKFDAATDELEPATYDFIMCNAVLVHFPKAEAKQIIEKIYRALKLGGRAYFSVKSHEQAEEGWDERIGGRRFFSYWTEEEYRTFLEQTGFTIVELFPTVSSHGNWLNTIVKKEEA